jgi:KipI family sensor histidine kinase inhibitor
MTAGRTQAGDSAVIVEFEEVIDPVVNRRVVALARALRHAPPPGVRETVPTNRSVAVYFDPLVVSRPAVEQWIDAACAGLEDSAVEERSPVVVPVCYGGPHGPDLDEVAALVGLTPAEVVDLHARRVYRVYMLGFLPGFAYMAHVDSRIAAPRRATPRLKVPIGSVGVAGSQTGVYPSESPGGWQLLGRTPFRPFDPARDPVFLFQPGDLVRFEPIDAARYDELAATGATP